MAILKRYTQLNRSGSNHSILDAESGYITGTFQVGGGTILGDSVADLVQVTGSIETTVATTAKFFGGLSGSLTQLTDGTSYLIAGTGIGITSASNGAVTIASTAAAAPEYWFSTENQAVYTTGSALFRGPAGTADSPADLGTDLFFFVSGTIGSKDTATTGTAAFGGDLVVSGAAYFENSTTALKTDGPGSTFLHSNNVSIGQSVADNFEVRSNSIFLNDVAFAGPVIIGDQDTDLIQVTGSIDAITPAKFRGGLSGSLTQLTDGTSYLIAGAGIGITSASNGAVTIASTAMAAPEYWFSTQNQAVYTTGSALFRGPAGTEDSPSDIGTDLFFFVSGTVGSWGTATTGTAGFGGDVVISGNLHLGTPALGAVISDANGSTIISRIGNDVNLGDSGTGVGITGNEIKAGLGNLLALSFTGSNTTAHGDLIALGNSFFSGSVFLGDSSADSIQVTGSLDVANSAIFRSGLSGSLTQLADGTSYIIAGAGITVTSASNGAITIASTGEVETPPELYYDTVADTAATSGSLAVTGSLTLATAGTGYRKLVVGDLDIGPITGAMATVNAGPGIMSGSILSASQGVWDGTNAAMLRHEFHIVGISTDASAYYAGSYLVSTFVSAVGVQSAVGATETSRETAGAASAWDVNINSNVEVTVTGSAGLTVNWYAQRTKEMSISADGSRT